MKWAQGFYKLKNPKKYIGKNRPRFRSSWEFQFMKFCDDHQSVLQWASESIHINYRNPFTSKMTIYVPDFFVVYVDKNGSKHAEVVEVKPANQTFREAVGKSAARQAEYVKNMAKWEAANAWCKQQGIKFRIVSENDLFHNGSR